MENNKIISVRNLKTYFPIQAGVFKKTVGYVKAVDGVSVDLLKGETLALVGESGCGKTTLGKSILQLIKPSSGEVIYHGDGKDQDLTKLNNKEMDEYRKRMQIVFQDPYSSLNPSFTIYASLSEPLKKFGMKDKKQRMELIGNLLKEVNLPAEYMNRYPNEFSGGQLQRIGIARALSVNPECIVLDEAVSALDVSIQAQVLKLLINLKNKNNLSYIFISHDLSVVEYIADRVMVMYLGTSVELAETDELYSNPLHPYTTALLSAIPVADVIAKHTRRPLQGDVPSPSNPPSGCYFNPRCPLKREICEKVKPEFIEYNINGQQHHCRCHVVEEKYKNYIVDKQKNKTLEEIL